MTLLVVAIPVAIGFVLGSLVPVKRFVLLLVPALAVALAYWVLVGWHGDDYDIGKAGLVIFTGLFAVAFLALWTVGVALGRVARGTYLADSD